MRIRPLSDLHFEFMPDTWDRFIRELPKDCDVLALAGDLTSHHVAAPSIRQVIRAFSERFRVVYLPGNHEFYGSTPARTTREIVEAAGECRGRVDWLNRSAITIDGQRFIGGTLWFQRPRDDASKWAMNDFHQIGGFEPWVYEENDATRSYLRDNVTADDVVVTHHLPSGRCVAPKYVGSPLNRFFVSSMDSLIESTQPRAWIFGHTHESVDIEIGRTRLVCNPFGYERHEENAAFDPGKTIEVTP